jgi:hypothetical protein
MPLLSVWLASAERRDDARQIVAEREAVADEEYPHRR